MKKWTRVILFISLLGASLFSGAQSVRAACAAPDLGAELDNDLRIVSIFDFRSSLAREAGAKVGDKVLSIDGVPLTNDHADETWEIIETRRGSDSEFDYSLEIDAMAKCLSLASRIGQQAATISWSHTITLRAE